MVILANANTITRNSPTLDDYAGSIHGIVEQARKMANIVDRLMNFSRQSGVDRPIDDLAALAEQVIGLLGPVARKSRVELELESSETLAVHADAQGVEQVLTNLIMNAIDAQPDGGSVIVGLRPTRVPHPGAPEARDVVCIEVRDTGPGISPHIRARVFEAFFTTKPPGQGTGLGLSVSQQIVKGFGGWMELDGGTGKGACFRVFLPRRSQE